MRILVGCFILLLAAPTIAQNSASMLDALLDERVKINQGYVKLNVGEAKTSKYPKQLMYFEQKVGDTWGELFAYAKRSNDPQLKKIVLKLEYYDELRGYTYDLDFAENDDEKKEAFQSIQKYQQKLKSIE